MKAGHWCLLGLLTVLAAREAGAVRVPKEVRPPRRPAQIHELTDDTMTHPVIQVYAKDRPLREIAEAIGHELKMHNTVDDEVADEKATLFLDRRPGFEIMSILSRQFNLQWTPTRGGYRLMPAPQRAERAAARLEQDRLQQLALLRSWLESVSRLSRESNDRLTERRHEIDRELAGEAGSNEARLRLAGERSILNHLFRAGSEPARTAYAALSAAQREEVLAGKEVRTPLPGGDTATVRLTSNPGPLLTPLEAIPGRMRVEVRAEGKTGLRTFVWSPLLPVDAPAPSTAEDSPDTQLNRYIVLDPTTLPLPPTSPLTPPEWQPGLMEFSDVLETVRKEIGFEMVSDSFSRARLDPRAILGQRTVRNMLETIAGQLNYTWKKDGNLIVWHSRTDFRERAEEVPEDQLRTLRHHVSLLGGVNLNILGEVVAKLNEEQIRGLQQYWGWYVEGSAAATTEVATTLYEHRDDLRFWGTLAPERLRSASAGDFVPFREMSPLEQQAFVRASGGASPVVSPPPARREKHTRPAVSGFQVDRSQRREQLFEVSEAGGRKSRLVLQRPAEEGDDPFNPPAGAKPLGEPTLVDSYTFSYYANDRETPARAASFDVPRARGKRGEAPDASGTPKPRGKG